MFKTVYYSLVILLSNIGNGLPQIVSYSDENDPAYVPRVVNGWAAKLGDVPYQLAFKYRRGYVYRTFCGGSIIGPNKVVSAAHCFQDKQSLCTRSCGTGKIHDKILRKAYAVAGNLMNSAFFSSKDSTENGQWRKLSAMYIPARYKFPRNDISVGFTSRPFVFNSYVSPIPYATVYRDYVGTCLVSGYGRISNRRDSERLLLAHLGVYSVSTCSRLHHTYMGKFVCTSDYVSDVHKGDSGGPLVCTGTGDPAETSKGLLIGVVSGNRYGSGSFFTRVSTFNSFIASGKSFSIRANVTVVFMCLLYSGIAILILFYFYRESDGTSGTNLVPIVPSMVLPIKDTVGQVSTVRCQLYYRGWPFNTSGFLVLK